MVNPLKLIGRSLTSPVGAVQSPDSSPHDVLNVGPGGLGVRPKIAQMLRGVSSPVRGAADLTATLSAAGALSAIDAVSGADIVPETVQNTVLSASSQVMSTLGETASQVAEAAYEGALNALPEWVKTGVEMADYMPDFLSVSGQVVQYLISYLGEDADNIVLLGQLTAAMLISQAISGTLATLNVRRTKIDRVLSAGVKASVAAVLGVEALQAFNGQADLIGDLPIPLTPNQIADMQANGHWLLDAAQRQTTWGKTALSAAGLTGLWAAWDGLKGYAGEIGLLERRKDGWLDRHIGQSDHIPRGKINGLACEGPDCKN